LRFRVLIDFERTLCEWILIRMFVGHYSSTSVRNLADRSNRHNDKN
jgi:hypothetical protein